MRPRTLRLTGLGARSVRDVRDALVRRRRLGVERAVDAMRAGPDRPVSVSVTTQAEGAYDATVLVFCVRVRDCGPWMQRNSTRYLLREPGGRSWRRRIHPYDQCGSYIRNGRFSKDYDAAAIKCGKIDDDVQRRACRDAAHEKYWNCSRDCVQAQRSCTDMFTACQDKGWPCTRRVDVYGTTLCRACQKDCLANNPYKFSDCYICGFE